MNKVIEKTVHLDAPWPYFADDEIAAVERVLKSGQVNYWTGEEVKQFEKEFAAYCGSSHAIALANGTVALELALYALEIGVGDEVIVPSSTFIATASAVVARGAKPVVVDVDSNTQNISSETIAEAITGKTKAIIVVHLAGLPCDMDAIVTLAKQHGLLLIEDCAQAHGASYKGIKVGNIGDIGVFSFCQDKIMTTGGEGGMLVTNNKDAWQKAWSYKDHGKNYQKIFNVEHPPGFRWLHDDFGTNWRMTEMQAAIGRVQLGKLDEWLKIRRRNAGILKEYCLKIPALRVYNEPDEIGHAYYKFYVTVDPNKLNSDYSRDDIMQLLNERGVPCFSGICAEIHKEQAFIRHDYQPLTPLSNAEKLGKNRLMFLIHPTLSVDDMHFMGTQITDVLSLAQL